MSTRRARIKAVASLPPRRKNVVATENKVKDTEEMPSDEYKSPRSENVTDSNTHEHVADHVLEKLVNSEKSASSVTMESESLSKTNPPIVQHVPEEVHSVDIESNPCNVFAAPIAPSPNAEYIILSDPESTDVEAMDGIVPFKPAASVAKPINVLKNEMKSENAEVFFAPIVPLPSTSKVHPLLRPVPIPALLGRNIVQGNASESEDEKKDEKEMLPNQPNRDIGRVRNDSVGSGVIQVATQPAASASPVRDKQQIHETQEESRRRMAMRRRREIAKREPLTMYDHMFYNPTSNPLVLNEDEIILKEAKEKQEAEKITNEKETVVKPPDSPKKSTDSAPVPQIKLGPKGEIILDEQSLVIKQTESDRKVSSVVHEGACGTGGLNKKLNFRRSRRWNEGETVRFYRALASVGTDFTLMTQLFPDRTRKQLKYKFKMEEKKNCAQVDKALSSTKQFDVDLLMAAFEEERETAAKQAEMEREELRMLKQAEKMRNKTGRRSLGAKALEISKVCRRTNTHTSLQARAPETINALLHVSPLLSLSSVTSVESHSSAQSVRTVLPSPAKRNRIE